MDWRQLNNKRLPYIRLGEAMFYRMYSQIRSSLIAEIRKLERPGEVEAVLREFSFDAYIEQMFERYYVKTAVDFASDFVSRQKGLKERIETKDVDMWTEKVIEFVRTKCGLKITQITRTHYEDIINVARAAVETGLNEGWGMEKIAREMLKTQREMDLWKARRIARTEVVAASNEGTMLGAGDVAGAKEKVWISSFDSRSRDEHMAMDGVTVDYNDKFDVAGDYLDFPGDPAGLPESVINCRCGCEVFIKPEII